MIKIGNVVEQLGLPASTIRYYEKIGLIKPLARVGNSRYLNDTDIAQLKFIQMSQSVGFSINEIKDLLELFLKNGVNTEDCTELVLDKIQELDERILELQSMRDALAKASECDCSSLEDCVDDIETFGCR